MVALLLRGARTKSSFVTKSANEARGGRMGYKPVFLMASNGVVAYCITGLAMS